MTTTISIFKDKFYIIYAVLIFLILTFGCSQNAPAQNPAPGRVFIKCSPSGTITNYLKNRDIVWDSCNNKYYMMRNDLKFYEINFAKGEKGNQGLNGIDGQSANIQVGTTNTGAPGTQAQVTNSGSSTNAIFNFVIPQGIQGQPGSGGTASLNGLISPDNYGAVHANRTFAQDGKSQSYIDANYSGLGLTTADQVDLGALMMAFKSAKGVVLYGNYYVNKSVKRPKYQDLMVYGNWAKINTTNSNTFDVFTSDIPTSVADANQMEGYSVTLKQLIFNIQGGQTGVKPNACFMLYLEQVYSYGGNTGFKLEFCLLPILSQCRAQSCTNGFILTHSGFSGGDGNNSQTNYCIMDNCRTHTVSNVALGIYSCYGAKINTFTCEGNGTINRVIDYDAQGSTTTKDLYVNMLHLEQTGGCNEAIFKISSRDSKVYIYDAIAHYKGLLVDATSSTGLGLVHMDKINYAVGDVNGKLYKSNNTTWFFELCETTPYITTIPNAFVGTAPAYCTTPNGCGYGKFGMVQIPR